MPTIAASRNVLDVLGIPGPHLAELADQRQLALPMDFRSHDHHLSQ